MPREINLCGISRIAQKRGRSGSDDVTVCYRCCNTSGSGSGITWTFSRIVAREFPHMQLDFRIRRKFRVEMNLAYLSIAEGMVEFL
jgi:hypothetical protein